MHNLRKVKMWSPVTDRIYDCQAKADALVKWATYSEKDGKYQALFIYLFKLSQNRVVQFLLEFDTPITLKSKYSVFCEYDYFAWKSKYLTDYWLWWCLKWTITEHKPNITKVWFVFLHLGKGGSLFFWQRSEDGSSYHKNKT